jgi:hypothetical protein
MNGQEVGPPAVQQGSLSRLIRYLIELSQAEAWANIRVVVQRGRITFIHVDRTFTLNSLPLKGEPEHQGEKASPPVWS